MIHEPVQPICCYCGDDVKVEKLPDNFMRTLPCAKCEKPE